MRARVSASVRYVTTGLTPFYINTKRDFFLKNRWWLTEVGNPAFYGLGGTLPWAGNPGVLYDILLF